MAFPVTVSEILLVLGLTADSSSDIATTDLIDTINHDADEIREICEDNTYDLTALTTHQTRLLSLCNWFVPAAEIILRRGASKDPKGFIVFHQALIDTADYLKAHLRAGTFDQSWFKSTAIPDVSLVTAIKASRPVPSFTPSASTTPNDTFVLMIADYWSAFVYSVAAGTSDLYLVPSSTAGLTTAQLDTYQKPVVSFTASLVSRMRASAFLAPQLGIPVQHKLGKVLYDRGLTEIAAITNGDKYNSFN